MRPISASDSVTVAVQRTRDFLFRPFTWGSYLKLGLVAIITEGVGLNLHSSSHNDHSSAHVPMAGSPFDIPAGTIAAIVAAMLLAALLAMFIFYLITRLRFAFFHCLIHNTREIRPGWHIYREPATRFFWLNVVVGICYLLLLGLVSLPFIAGFMRLVHDMQPGAPPNWALLFGLLLPLIPIIFLMVLLGVLADLVLRDWIMPHYALDNAAAGDAWASVWASFNADRRQFLVYLLLRIVLPVIAMIGLFVVLLLPGLALAGVVAAIWYALHGSFAGSTGASAAIGSALQAFFGLVGFFFLVLGSICLGGPVSTGTREYALTFYGGRYPALGDILQPPLA